MGSYKSNRTRATEARQRAEKERAAAEAAAASHELAADKAAEMQARSDNLRMQRDLLMAKRRGRMAGAAANSEGGVPLPLLPPNSTSSDELPAGESVSGTEPPAPLVPL